MNIARFEPWNFVDLLHRNLDAGPANGWFPAVDVVEEKTRFVLRADVPGVNPEDIDVSMDKGVLSVSGERHTVAGEEETGLQRIERASGRFERRFKLPKTANADAIKARVANGILEVSIEKTPEIQPRRITVEAA